MTGANDNGFSNIKPVITVTDATFGYAVLRARKPVLVECNAPWSEQCRLLTPTIDAIAAGRRDLCVARLNAEENKNITKDYDITSVPTLLLFNEGRLVHRIEGARPKAILLKEIDTALNGGAGVKHAATASVLPNQAAPRQAAPQPVPQPAVRPSVSFGQQRPAAAHGSALRFAANAAPRRQTAGMSKAFNTVKNAAFAMRPRSLNDAFTMAAYGLAGVQVMGGAYLMAAASFSTPFAWLGLGLAARQGYRIYQIRQESRMDAQQKQERLAEKFAAASRPAALLGRLALDGMGTLAGVSLCMLSLGQTGVTGTALSTAGLVTIASGLLGMMKTSWNMINKDDSAPAPREQKPKPRPAPLGAAQTPENPRFDRRRPF